MGICHSKPPPEIPTQNVSSIAIIGGGIAGVSSAYYLAKKGINVTIYERNPSVGGETSYGPAAVTLFKPVKKSFDLDGTINLTSASISDAIRYSEGAVHTLLDKHPERKEIVKEAQTAYEEFSKMYEGKSSAIHDKDGLLYILDKKCFQQNQKVFKNDDSMDFYTKEEFEKNQELYDPLFDGAEYHGVLHSKEEGFVDPHLLSKFMAQQVEELGGKVCTNMHVERIEEEAEDGVVKVFVDGKVVAEHDACVVALGAFPAPFLKDSGYEDKVKEIYGVKGYSVTGIMPEGTLRRGVVDGIDTKFIRPFHDKNGTYGVRFGGITDPYSDEDPLKIDWDRMNEFAKNPMVNKLFENNSFPTSKEDSDVLHDCVLEGGRVEVWTGIRPVNKHGRMPLVRNVNGSTKTVLVSGFGANGFVMCWWAGTKVASKFEPKEETKEPMMVPAQVH